MTTKLLIDRELLERIDESAICDGTDATISDDLFTQLVAALAAPRQPEEDAASILLPALRQYMHNDGSGLLAGYEYERTQQIVAELREECEHLKACQENAMLHMTGLVAERDTLRQQLAEKDAEIERLRVKLMTIASAEPGRHNIEWAKAMAATGSNEAYAKWREAFDQRDKLAGLLRDARELIDHGDFREGHCMCGSGVEGHSLGDGHAPVDAGEYYAGQVRERIDAALAEVEKAR